MHAARGLEFKKVIDRYVGIPLVWGCHLLDETTSLWRKAEPLKVDNILLCKLWGIGNLVMILPFINALRRRFPDASLSFLTTEANRSLLEQNPNIDHVYTMRTRGTLGPILDILRLIPSLRKQRFDLFLDFEQFLRISAILGFMANATQRIGLATPGQGRASLYHAKVPYRRDQHMTRVFGDVVRSAGVDVEGLPSHSVPRCSKAYEQVRAKLSSMIPGSGISGSGISGSGVSGSGISGFGPVVVIHPGSGDHFPGRRWPVERFAELADRLSIHEGAHILVSGSMAESDLVESVIRTMKRPGVSIAGMFKIQGFIELIAQVDLVISNDTAPVHIASALGTPLVALYGPNTPELYGPLHRASRAVYDKLPCSPCLSNLSAKTSNCRLPACILGVEVDRVFHDCQALLSESCVRSIPS